MGIRHCAWLARHAQCQQAMHSYDESRSAGHAGVQCARLVQPSLQLSHGVASGPWHDFGPDESGHTPIVGSHLVFAMLLAEYAVGGRIARSKILLLLGLTVELAEVAVFLPVEVGHADRAALLTQHPVLQFRLRNSIAVELDAGYRLACRLRSRVGEEERDPSRSRPGELCGSVGQGANGDNELRITM